jgi:hypothetical protein
MNHRQKFEQEKFLSFLMLGHTHALTVTLRNDSSFESISNRKLRFEQTIRHLLHRIARQSFKSSHKRKGLRIGSVAVLEGGNDAARLHAHLALACPPTIDHDQFRSVVLTAVRKCVSLGPQVKLKLITDVNEWARYISKEGPEAFSPICSQQAKH